MKEFVIISGKGGTGKTSITASFAVLADRPVIADCDVDAADLHLVLSPQINERNDFWSGHEAVIREDACVGCGRCFELCRMNAIAKETGTSDSDRYYVDPVACEGCGVCVRACPVHAIGFPEKHCGVWMISSTRCGPMVHARLGIASENSGKLVSMVRSEARRIAEIENREIVLIDGPPGIGCPVIASITGASKVLVVTEPTVSGEHDLKRVLALANHFKISTAVCVNKWDLNPNGTQRIEQCAVKTGAILAGRIRYDPAVTSAQLEMKAVVETQAPSTNEIINVWRHFQED